MRKQHSIQGPRHGGLSAPAQPRQPRDGWPLLQQRCALFVRHGVRVGRDVGCHTAVFVTRTNCAAAAYDSRTRRLFSVVVDVARSTMAHQPRAITVARGDGAIPDAREGAGGRAQAHAQAV